MPATKRKADQTQGEVVLGMAASNSTLPTSALVSKCCCQRREVTRVANKAPAR